MEFELDSLTKIRLLKPVRSRSGNHFPPGDYLACEIPKQYHNAYYIKVFNQDSPVLKNDPIVVNLPEQKVDPKWEVKNEVKDPVTQPGARKIKINLDSEAEMSSIVGLGKASIKKVIENRLNGFFLNYEDLNARVTLPFGNKWEKFDIEFSFE